MKIKIICIGKIKEPYLVDGIKEFSKRMNKYAALEVLEIPEDNNKNSELSKDKEGNNILARIKDGEYVIALDLIGKEICSEDLSRIIQKTSKIVFIIGGSYGLSKDVLYRANIRISFSKLTFTHQMIRLFLYEQIYRAFTIINHENYHK